MNLFDATLTAGDGAMRRGVRRLPPPRAGRALAARPALRSYADRTIVLGIRPEDMEDAALVTDAPPERRISSIVELREALGSDVVVHFTVDAPPAMTEDVKELARRRRRGGARTRRAAGRRRAVHRARSPQPALDRRQGRARSSSSSTPTGCTSSIPTDGAGIYGDEPERRQPRANPNEGPETVPRRRLRRFLIALFALALSRRGAATMTMTRTRHDHRRGSGGRTRTPARSRC